MPDPANDDVVALTKRLLAFDTTGPAAHELPALEFCADWLGRAGFDCALHAYSGESGNLVAMRGGGAGLPLCFSGHLDTVPPGDAPWTHAPFAGVEEGDRLFGRGASDMKGAIAAFMIAARDAPPPPGGIVIVLSSGEEIGCAGARQLVAAGHAPRAGAMIVGEATDNAPLAGHKGALWLRLIARGRTAHGATPELGDNAILRMAPVLMRLGDFRPGGRHPVMGRTTANAGTVRGGLNVNSVPDRCELMLDLRPVHGVSAEALRREVQALAGDAIAIETVLDLPAVWTAPGEGWFAAAARRVAAITGVAPRPRAASYFTDAAVLRPAMGDLPVMILGPGSSDQPHRTDEHVLIPRLDEAVRIYGALIADWGRTGTGNG